MLPANGLPLPLGEKEYWPVYAEAERLGCALAVHGGRGARLGFDSLGVRPAGHALGHPISVLISLTSFVFNGVFDHFPGLRVAFLEGGVAWFLVAWERFDRSYWTHIPYNPRRELLELDSGTTVADYLGRLAESGRLVVGCEGSEPDLARAVSLIGSAFMFSSDFPHEVSIQMCKDEIAEIRDSEGISSAQKEDLLAETARRFYRLD
jgi:predicted TIM-barrel fold metal-dependent hydrolase